MIYSATPVPIRMTKSENLRANRMAAMRPPHFSRRGAETPPYNPDEASG
jgi:hypothetical protein